MIVVIQRFLESSFKWLKACLSHSAPPVFRNRPFVLMCFGENGNKNLCFRKQTKGKWGRERSVKGAPICQFDCEKEPKDFLYYEPYTSLHCRSALRSPSLLQLTSRGQLLPPTSKRYEVLPPLQVKINAFCLSHLAKT